MFPNYHPQPVVLSQLEVPMHGIEDCPSLMRQQEKVGSKTKTIKQENSEELSKSNSSNCKENGKRRIKAQIWSLKQLKTIFQLYEEYGSQWKIIETEFVDRYILLLIQTCQLNKESILHNLKNFAESFVPLASGHQG